MVEMNVLKDIFTHSISLLIIKLLSTKQWRIQGTLPQGIGKFTPLFGLSFATGNMPRRRYFHFQQNTSVQLPTPTHRFFQQRMPLKETQEIGYSAGGIKSETKAIFDFDIRINSLFEFRCLVFFVGILYKRGQKFRAKAISINSRHFPLILPTFLQQFSK